MSIKPVDIIMSITTSQNIKPPDPDHFLKESLVSQTLQEQNLKNKESVAKIPEDENNAELMDTIKQGMSESGGQSSDKHLPPNKDDLLPDVPEKGLLDDDNGHSLDIMG